MAMTDFDTIDEGTTPVYQTTLKYPVNGVLTPLTGLPFTGARLSYYSTLTGAIVNNRDNQNILNANNVTIDTAGVLTWKLQEADVLIADGETVPPVVKYRGEFVLEWLDGAGSAREISHEIEIPIRRFVKRPFIP